MCSQCEVKGANNITHVTLLFPSLHPCHPLALSVDIIPYLLDPSLALILLTSLTIVSPQR